MLRNCCCRSGLLSLLLSDGKQSLEQDNECTDAAEPADNRALLFHRRNPGGSCALQAKSLCLPNHYEGIQEHCRIRNPCGTDSAHGEVPGCMVAFLLHLSDHPFHNHGAVPALAPQVRQELQAAGRKPEVRGAGGKHTEHAGPLPRTDGPGLYGIQGAGLF